MKVLISLVFYFVCILSFCQSDTCLTTDFSKLKSKKRIEVARRELKESELDTVYQNLMDRGDSLFKLQLYKESLGIFLDARKRRPYNVYPKIKIHDLNILLKKSKEVNIIPDTTNIDPEFNIIHVDEPEFLEKSFYEGNAYIIERTISVGDSSNTYRRVINPHNTYYFLNGISIDSRVWNYQFRK